MTNPLFYVKLVLVACGVSSIPAIRRYVVHCSDVDPRVTALKGRLLAATAIALWATTIIVGRLLPYTYSRLFVDR
jgi:hypothetical protein